MRGFRLEYALEALGLAVFMVAASVCAVLLEHPGSPLHRVLPDAFARRCLMGAVMGATAVALIYSPIGRRSGAHFNPATTLAFLGLGRVAPRDALAYIASQFAGGALGIELARLPLDAWMRHPAVHYIVTRPGLRGPATAFGAELAISAVLLLGVLTLGATRRFASWAGALAGVFVALYIAFEAPLSGMSMNPARSFASAFAAADWHGWWIYFVAPPLGMLLGARLHLGIQAARARAPMPCAKLVHDSCAPCLFCARRAAAELPVPAAVRHTAPTAGR